MNTGPGAEQAIPAEKSICILVVEDHPVFLEGLRTIIGSQKDIRLVAHAANATEAISEYRLHRPHVTLMDLGLPGASGIDTMVAIRAEFAEARVIFLAASSGGPTTSNGDVDIERTLRAGASAYVMKNTPKDELLEVIRSVHAGNRHVPAEIATRLAEHLGDGTLTPRELDVLRLIREGSKNKEIAAQLNISETTVNFHIKNLVNKLEANDWTHAVTIALRRGMIEM